MAVAASFSLQDDWEKPQGDKATNRHAIKIFIMVSRIWSKYIYHKPLGTMRTDDEGLLNVRSF